MLGRSLGRGNEWRSSMFQLSIRTLELAAQREREGERYGEREGERERERDREREREKEGGRSSARDAIWDAASERRTELFGNSLHVGDGAGC